VTRQNDTLSPLEQTLGAPAAPLLLVTLGFVVLATLNSVGYRYGAADQAFYVPAVVERLAPTAFPRDGELIRSQARLTLADETIATVVHATGLSTPAAFATLYVVTLAILVAAAWLIGGSLYRTRWTTLALLAALTMKHAVAKSGTNTLEGYFHPRQLAFALGAVAIASFLRERLLAAVALVGMAGLFHPTTAMWFAIWIGIAVMIERPRTRAPLLLTGTLLMVWTVAAGPLAGRLAPMDSDWLATLKEKDYLFPLEWPVWVWFVNAGYVALVVWPFLRRRAARLVSSREQAIVIGALSLVAIFLLILPFNIARIQLAVQLQPARAFWMLDFLATIYVVWLLAEYRTEILERRARLVAVAILALATVRGLYVMFVEFPERPVVALDIPDTDWGRAMRWARGTNTSSGWLADPMHAVLYGTSVRVAGERDVFVEGVKDVAIGMYDRGVAMRTRDRLNTLGDFRGLTTDRARDLARRFDLDYVVTEQVLELPVAFTSGALKVYRLR
jgi:hypothetical protein